MTSTPDRHTKLLEPQPPALLPPWHTPEREALQLQARRFATDEVLPVANELDPQKGLIPASLLARLAELGWFGITVPAEHGGVGPGVLEDCMGSEGAGPRLGEHRQHPGPRPGPGHGAGRRRPPP